MKNCHCYWKMVFIAIMMPLLLAWNTSQAAACNVEASPACYFSFQPANSQGQMHYYASLNPSNSADLAKTPSNALIVMHGHPRDADTSFNAGLLAAQNANVTNTTLVVAPLFQVAQADAENCTSTNLPIAQQGDLLWTCSSWLVGGAAANDATLNSFDALSALLAELKKRWPSLQVITVAGFSAGAQMVQHYIGFTNDLPGVRLRYVVASPGTWLYFDSYRTRPEQNGKAVDWSVCSFVGQPNCQLKLVPISSTNCTNVNHWKYGVDLLPTNLKRSGAQAMARYAQAEVYYLGGALDSSSAKGAYYPILDKTCAANAQGPFRLQRALGYAEYDRIRISPTKNRSVTIVPGCAHDVGCVFPAPAARMALFGQ